MDFSPWKKPSTRLAQGALNFDLLQVNKPQCNLDLNPAADFRLRKRVESIEE